MSLSFGYSERRYKPYELIFLFGRNRDFLFSREFANKSLLPERCTEVLISDERTNEERC